MSSPSDPSGAFQRSHPSEGMQALEKERKLPLTGWQQEVDQAKRFGLEAAESIVDRNISTFSRGELPHFAGINTFMKAPYLEDVNQVGNYDVAIVGVPHDCGTTYRPGTRFGPQGIRRISALYTPYNYEMGVDLREQITLCDVGDIFTIPANNEKSFDQISKGIAHVFSSGAFPIILGGDHSIGFPTVRGVCRHLGDRKVGIIHFDRHVDTQETDLDERMHTCPWFHATNMANAPAANLVQLGIGGQKKDMAVLMGLNHNGQAITLSKKLADKGAVDGASLYKLMQTDKREYTFAQTFPTGTHAMWLYSWLAANGINPMKDAKVITVPPPQMVANMRVGNMDGFCVGEPWGHRAIVDGVGITAIMRGARFYRL